MAEIEPPVLDEMVGFLQRNCSERVSETTELSYGESLSKLDRARYLIRQYPYCLPLYVAEAQLYLHLAYPDLAAGAAYKALLLSDAVQDEDDEYHDRALNAVSNLIPQMPLHHSKATDNLERHEVVDEDNANDDNSQVHIVITTHYVPLIYELLCRGLLLCGCYKTAFKYCSQAHRLFPDNSQLRQINENIRGQAVQHLNVDIDKLSLEKYGEYTAWPDSGFVRREQYPWDTLEPDRLWELITLNDMMAEVAPKLEILAVELPDLAENPNSTGTNVVKQLGVFAKEDIAPGEIILNENSIVTANNKLQDALCDACSADLPPLDSAEAEAIASCPECEVVFCSSQCYNDALRLYHPSLCGADVESIAKDVSPAQAADALYSLLLLRTLAMAETQSCHPLELKEVNYIWGDYCKTPAEDYAEAWKAPKTLPFSFEHNIRLPFHMLEKMDIDIFANPQYDVWVFNTLYAKFRGTASARLSGRGGPARGPEVSAVHPMWCMANHSCDPNVSWSWDSNIQFRVREERPTWQNAEKRTLQSSKSGIRKGEEILNHYCDIDLPVQERREWARGALGGDCRCARCLCEAGQI